ncbi:lytic transglycosylase domain-containing protein [Kosakonia sp. YIM B13611]|uniref:lytic transglycosylase domain-containing protein n=1 Tax=unclassified Kosakonia TaxID=2632876 RepID=UPI0036BF5A9E
MLSSSAFLAAAMHCAASIPPSTTFDVARVESGFNPYAIAEIVPKSEITPGKSVIISHQPTSRLAALNIAKQIAAKGRRYSVGLMQITSTNFQKFSVAAKDLLDPCINLSIFERILTDCYRRGGTLPRALSCYYSGNFETGQQPEPAFNQTSYLQRIGYAVPSTRQKIERYTTSRPILNIRYPSFIIRGVFADPPQQALPSLKYPNAVMRGDLSIPVLNEEK